VEIISDHGNVSYCLKIGSVERRAYITGIFLFRRYEDGKKLLVAFIVKLDFAALFT